MLLLLLFVAPVVANMFAAVDVALNVAVTIAAAVAVSVACVDGTAVDVAPTNDAPNNFAIFFFFQNKNRNLFHLNST